MCAQLRSQSFVTGVLYVNLDMYPEIEPQFVGDPSVKYVEIPTLPTALEQAQMKATQFVAKLADYDLRALLDSIAHTITDLDHLLISPDVRAALAALPPAVRKIDSAVGELQTTLASVHHLADHVDTQV